MKKYTEIYIDASFSDNRDKAGYGAVIIRGNKTTEMSGIIKGAKNSTEAEIFAVSNILEFLKESESMIIYNDNMACVDVINGGKLNKKSPEINKAISNIRKHKGKIRGKWVRGHDTCKENCRADELAREKLF
jgi:ribonuclease HI